MVGSDRILARSCRCERLSGNLGEVEGDRGGDEEPGAVESPFSGGAAVFSGSDLGERAESRVGRHREILGSENQGCPDEMAQEPSPSAHLEGELGLLGAEAVRVTVAGRDSAVPSLTLKEKESFFFNPTLGRYVRVGGVPMRVPFCG